VAPIRRVDQAVGARQIDDAEPYCPREIADERLEQALEEWEKAIAEYNPS
jgi:hypothetical protein